MVALLNSRGEDRTTQFEDAVTNFFVSLVLCIPVNSKGTDAKFIGLLADLPNWNELAI